MMTASLFYVDRNRSSMGSENYLDIFKSKWSWSQDQIYWSFLQSIVTIYVWLTTGFGQVNGFIDHLNIPLGTTNNYKAITNLHILQITTAPAKPFSSLLCHQPLPDNGF
jgi:hypothetical protein